MRKTGKVNKSLDFVDNLNLTKEEFERLIVELECLAENADSVEDVVLSNQ